MNLGRLAKDCKCWSTSSGPRVLISRVKPWDLNVAREATDAVNAEVKLVNLACDACDKPWVDYVDPGMED